MFGLIFKNREQAGERLSRLLESYRESNSVILALPRGGVVLAKQISRYLNLPLDLVVVRKIGHPVNSEFAIAAITENGKIAENKNMVEGVDPKWYEDEKKIQLEEARRRRAVYWGEKSRVDLSGKNAILVDDGLATGLTMLAAIAEVKSQNPAYIIVATPIAAAETARLIRSKVDEFIALLVTDSFLGSVGAYYEQFDQVSDEKVKKLIENNNEHD